MNWKYITNYQEKAFAKMLGIEYVVSKKMKYAFCYQYAFDDLCYDMDAKQRYNAAYSLAKKPRIQELFNYWVEKETTDLEQKWNIIGMELKSWLEMFRLLNLEAKIVFNPANNSILLKPDWD